MTKKNIIIISIAGVVFFCLFIFSTQIGICKVNDLLCFQRFDTFAEHILIFIPLFLLSLITYKMKDIIFQAWFKFARVWVPLSIILIILSPEYGNSLLPVEKGSVSFFMSALFLIISLIIIAYKSFKNSKLNHYH